MDQMVDATEVARQYRTESRLETRRSVWRDSADGRNPQDAAAQAVAGAAPGSVLEVGCGTGVFAARVMKENPQAAVLATDRSAALRRADRRAGRPRSAGRHAAAAVRRRAVRRRGGAVDALPRARPAPRARRGEKGAEAGRAVRRRHQRRRAHRRPAVDAGERPWSPGSAARTGSRVAPAALRRGDRARTSPPVPSSLTTARRSPTWPRPTKGWRGPAAVRGSPGVRRRDHGVPRAMTGPVPVRVAAPARLADRRADGPGVADRRGSGRVARLLA